METGKKRPVQVINYDVDGSLDDYVKLCRLHSASFRAARIVSLFGRAAFRENGLVANLQQQFGVELHEVRGW